MAVARVPHISETPGLLALAGEHIGRDPEELRRELKEAHGDTGIVLGKFPQAESLALIPELIPPRFREATFGAFEAATDSQKTALAAAKRFTQKAVASEPVMIALIGKQGTGKSHLLYAVALALLTRDHRAYVRPWYRLADELRYGGRSAFNGEKRLEPSEIRDQIWREKIVLLDEVRPTASTAFDDTELAKFACHAYDSNLAVLITTNVQPLSDVMGPAAASRFVQIQVDGPDRRQE